MVDAILQHSKFSSFLCQHVCADDFMSNFLDNSKIHALVYDNSLRKHWVLPNRASLLDFVAIDSQTRIDSWVTSRDNKPSKYLFKEFQNNKGLGRELLQRVEIREIIVGKTPDREIKTIAK